MAFLRLPANIRQPVWPRYVFLSNTTTQPALPFGDVTSTHLSLGTRLFACPYSNGITHDRALDDSRTDPGNVRLPTWSEIITSAQTLLRAHPGASNEDRLSILQGLQSRISRRPTRPQRRQKFRRRFQEAVEDIEPILRLKELVSNTDSVPETSVDVIPELEKALSNDMSAGSGQESMAMLDVEYVRTHMPLPASEEIPQRLRKLFDLNNPSEAILRFATYFSVPMRHGTVTLDSSSMFGSSKHSLWGTVVRLHIADLFEAHAVGAGVNKKQSGRAAWLHMLSKLHTSGVLARYFATTEQPAIEVSRKNVPHVTPRIIGELAEKPEPGEATQVACILKSQSRLDDFGRHPEKEVHNEETPTREQYPAAPSDLFDPEKSFKTIEIACQRQMASLRSETEQIVADKKQIVQVALEVNITENMQISAIGVGPNKKKARVNATASLLARLHTGGALNMLFPDSNSQISASARSGQDHIDVEASELGVIDDAQLTDVDEYTMKTERDAKLDVFNYAARFGLIPDFEAARVQPQSRRQRILLKQKPAVKVTVRLPEMGINVASTARDVGTAEIAAALEFKREAEKVDRSQEYVSPSSDFGVINLRTASEFFKFYQMHNRGLKIEIEHEQSTVANEKWHQVRIKIRDKTVGRPIAMRAKRHALAVAYLTAVIDIARDDHEILRSFAKAITKGKGRILTDIRPIHVAMPESTLELMQDALLTARRAGLQDRVPTLGEEAMATSTRSQWRRRISVRLREEKCRSLLTALNDYESSLDLSRLRSTRASFPMAQFGSQLLELVDTGTYCIVVGATGSGKTTQVPQILLDNSIRRGTGGYCDIICTQPRRIAASSVAQRVAEERGEQLQQSVGYHVRFDAKLPKPAGSVTYCTTGILLGQLSHDPDAVLNSVSHIVLDEVHERDLQIDFLMTILKKAIAVRREANKSVPKVILMSATLDQRLFSEYFSRTEKGEIVPCPILNVPGRSFFVQEKHLREIVQDVKNAHGKDFNEIRNGDRATKDFIASEDALGGDHSPSSGLINWKQDWRHGLGDGLHAFPKGEMPVPVKLVGATIAHICATYPNGAILVFLPGMDDISATQKFLLGEPVFGIDFNDCERYKICLLHSSIPSKEQNEIFATVPSGCRKIILSTNIAETSVTVPDVKYVVDSGKLREQRYDQTNRISTLQCTWAAESNVRQRAGRAGRVHDGNYFALFSRERRASMPASGIPEMLRNDLQEICLSVKAQGSHEPVEGFLSHTIQPPAASAVERSVERLTAMGAFTPEQRLTTLGRVLSRLPVHPSQGKMIVLGIIFRCLDPILILSCMVAERELFLTTPWAREAVRAAKKSYGQSDSDHLTNLAAFNDQRHHYVTKGDKAALGRAQVSTIHMSAFRSIYASAKQIEQALAESGLIPAALDDSGTLPFGGHALNHNKDNMELIRCLILAGVHPHLALKTGGRNRALHRTPTYQNVMRHPSSTIAASVEENLLYAFQTLASSADQEVLFMRESTRVTGLMAMLFGGTLTPDAKGNCLEMDEWLPFQLDAPSPRYAMKVVLEFRKAMDRVLHCSFNSLSELHQGQSLADNPIADELVSSVVHLLEMDASSLQSESGSKSADQT